MISGNVDQKLVMHLAPGHWAGHMRIYHRECLALVEGGYNVHLVAHDLNGERLDPRIHFTSLGSYGNSSLSWKLYDRYCRCRNAYSMAIEAEAGLYHFHSPEFIPLAIKIRRKTKRPVIFDCMEDFEGYALQRRGIPIALRQPLAAIVKRQLHSAAMACDAVVVSDRGTGKLLQPYAQRVVLIHNFPKVNLFKTRDIPFTEKPYDVVYHGSIPQYHLEACLAIDDVLVSLGYQLKWRFMGQIPALDWFEAELMKRNALERFVLSGLVGHETVARELVKAKIGIIPLPDLPKFQNNIPQKLFEFMAMGIPVVLSDLPPSRPFVGDGGCGFLVPPQDYQAFANSIIQLLNDPAIAVRMGKEGQKRVRAQYNWEKESQKLLNLYKELLEK